MRHGWSQVGRAAAALAAAMGIGRFAYTPILPLMTAHAGLTTAGAGHLATANYVGYLVGAVAGAVSARLTRSTLVWRASLVVLVATLAAMPLAPNIVSWLVLRALAGVASALVFVIAVNALFDRVADHHPHLPGWGLAGVGAGIALSGVLVLALPDAAGWKSAWWIAAVLAGALSAVAWSLGPAGDGGGAASRSAPRINRHFVVLFVSYSLEGVGYIVAATFLVAAIRQGAAGWLANGAWLFVGLAAAPSAAVWAMLSRRWSHRSLLVAALALQAVGIALPAVATGAAPALIGAVLFGATFMGVSTVALSAGRLLQLPAAAALLTAGYSAGQILGPVSVTPLLANGFRTALIVAALVVVAAASAAALLRIPQRTPAR